MGANTSNMQKQKETKHKNVSKPTDSEELDDKECLRPAGYRLQKTIGKGSYGKVKLAYSKHLSRDIAIKIIDPKKSKSDFKASFLTREKQVSYVVNHPNIVRCFDILECGPKVYMIFEYVENGDLCSYLHKKKFLEITMAKKIFRGVVEAITYLHRKRVAHRDLKLENILLTKDLTPKITDFGFTKRVMNSNHRSVTFCGSKMYCSFEILVGIPYNIFKADIWSLGVILYAMVTGYFPFREEKQIRQMKAGVSFLGVFQDVPLDLVALIRKMTETNPNKRPNIEAVRTDKWLDAGCNNNNNDMKSEVKQGENLTNGV